MGLRYRQHDGACGCERCAREWECDNPQPVFDRIEDPNYLDCGCSKRSGCDCDRWEDD